jgi:thiol-disulfide isomerase/thioredoxin
MTPPLLLSSPSRRLLLKASLLGPASVFVPLAQVQAQAIVRSWPANRAVPSLSLAQMEGGTRQLAHWRGRVLVLNFWASWCEPCVSELPSLLRLAEGQAERGLSVALVNYQEGEAKVRDFLGLVFGEIPEALPVLMDRDGAVAKAWTPRVLPTTVLVDRKGQPRWSVIGELDWTGPQARELIEPLLSQGR